MDAAVTLADVERARPAVECIAVRTPTLTSATLSARLGGTIVLKAEHLQRTGAFKIRGAAAKLAALGDGARAGVVAGSAGNHAQALALAARHAGVPAEIYVPKGASIAKMAACRGYGGIVHEVGDAVEEAVTAARERAATSGMVFCHPYDDEAVVAGQGTIGMEIAEDVPDLATVVVPLGGGGMLSGIATAVAALRPGVRIVGVQAEVCAPFAGRPAPRGAVSTLADGIAVKQPGAITRPIIDELVDEIVTVDEDEIADAMILLLERSKFTVEGGGAVGVAALLAGKVAPAASGTTCVVLSGGNLDLGLLPNLIRRHETAAHRRALLFVRVSDRPGGLAHLLQLVAESGANVIDVIHVREGVDLHVRESGLQLALEVRGRDHAAGVVGALEAAGFATTDLGTR
jgi:threonine dehydratase